MDVLQTLVPAVGWALLHFIWQGLLIGWGVALAMQLLRHARPHTRYAVACAGLLLCAALPVASVISQLHAAASGASSTVTSNITSGAGFGAITLIPALISGSGAGANLASSALFDQSALDAWHAVLRGRLPWVVGLWLTGAALMSLRLAIGLRWVAERTRSDRYTVNHYWQRRLSSLARRAGLAMHVRLGVADGLDSPITAGCWRPIVLVPMSLITGMPPELLEALLAHELAHIKRRDYLVNLIQSAVEIVLFYHPSVWALSRRIRIEREQIADDLAVSLLGQPQMLAKALSALDQFQFDTTQLAHAAHGGNLMSRIKRLLRPDVEPVSWKMLVPLLGLCAASAVFYVQAAPRPPAAAQSAAVVAPAAPAAPATAAAAPAVPATPAAPAAPAASATPAAPAAPMAADPMRSQITVEGMTILRGKRDSAYALVLLDRSRMTIAGNTDDMLKVADLRKTIKGEFIWFAERDKSYVIEDPALVAQALAAWEPVQKIDARMKSQGDQMQAQGKLMEAAAEKIRVNLEVNGGLREVERRGREIGQLAVRHETIARRLEQVAVESAALPVSAADQRALLEARRKQLQAQLAPLAREMDAQQIGIAAQSAKAGQNLGQEMGRRMAELSKPMGQMGREMGVLGRQRAQAQLHAEQAMKAVFKQALASGKAVAATPSA